MKFTLLGHSSFLIETKDGVRIITDPYKPGSFDNAVGYDPIDEEADIVTVSHDHDDHNYVEGVKGNPEVVKGSEAREVKGIKFIGLDCFHDEHQGSQRGRNVIYVFEAEGMRVAHFGDLGHTLNDEEVNCLGSIDILLLPVGGFYTIDATTAWEVVKKVNPKIVIPMHFKTDKLNFPITKVTDFAFDAKDADWVEKPTYEIEKENLPDHLKVVVLEPAR